MRADAVVPTVTSPVPREVWESVLKSDGNAVVTQSLPWRDALVAGGRFRDVSRLYEFPSGQRIILPLARRRLRPAGASVISSWPRPWGVGGPICQLGAVSHAEAAAVLADVASLGAVAAEIKLRHDADPNWLRSSSGFHTYDIDDWILDLNHGFSHVWEHQFRSSVRRAVRKAERSGLEIEVDRTGRLFGSFCELHQKSVVRWAAMQHAPAWLTRARLAAEVAPDRAKLIAESFGPEFAIWLARLAGQPVAAIVIVRANGYAKYLWGAMDKDAAGPARAADLLHKLAIEEACREGFRYYDLGGATVGSSLGAYKEKFGAALRRRHTLRIERIPVQRAMELPRAAAKKIIGFKDNL